ncbi:MAG TPA: long-chain fatty acid--CoA ligase, partial [Flavisolibacter sp.]
MTMPHRLFDCLDVLMKDSPNLVLLSGKEEGAWRGYTVTEVRDIVDKIAAGLLSLGLSPNDMTIENRDK